MRLINYVLVIVPLESLLTISNRYQIKMWRSISRKIITSFIPITRIFCDSYEIEKCHLRRSFNTLFIHVNYTYY